MLGRGQRAAAAVAFIVALLLLRLPFRTTVRIVEIVRGRCCRDVADVAQVAAVVATARRASRWYPGRAACLELSLTVVVTMTFLRRTVDWVIGVADDPYRFHAWIETEGVPVIDDFDLAFGDFRRVLTV
jgi:branched-subunit amino acid ABC-type transport system permease component